MTTISEDRQHLDFDPSWKVVKWDESGEFIGSMSDSLAMSAEPLAGETPQPANEPGNGVKAADVVGVGGEAAGPKIIFVAEFKDYAHPGIPPHETAKAAEKAESQETIKEIVRKVIDTLAGATFSHDSADGRVIELAEWRPALARSTTKIFVLVCVESPDPLIANIWTKELQRRLRWLGKGATVLATSSEKPFQGPGISYRL
jgi:hypothetical protein